MPRITKKALGITSILLILVIYANIEKRHSGDLKASGNTKNCDDADFHPHGYLANFTVTSSRNIEINIDVTTMGSFTLEQTSADNPQVQQGGRFVHCETAEHKTTVAIIFPYRNRLSHLQAQMRHLHPILQRQRLDYVMIVVEQVGSITFNRALLLNAGALESLKLYPTIDCFIFHDVDKFTLDDRGLYVCRDKPVDFYFYNNKYNFNGLKMDLFARFNLKTSASGIFAIRKNQFFEANGWSNVYFGWSGEDKDLALRLGGIGNSIQNPIFDRSKWLENREYSGWDHLLFFNHQHAEEEANPANSDTCTLLETATARMKCEGVSTPAYLLISTEKLPLFTKFQVDVDLQKISAIAQQCNVVLPKNLTISNNSPIPSKRKRKAPRIAC